MKALMAVTVIAMTTASYANDQQSEREIVAFQIVTAHLCAPVVEMPELVSKVVTAGHKRLVQAGHSEAAIAETFLEVQTSIAASETAAVDPQFCRTVLREFF